MNEMDPTTEHRVRVLVELLAREGRSEQEINEAVRLAQAEGGFAARTRRLGIVC